MKEIIIISGKGGTGKTSITVSMAALMPEKTVLADCDVDAADLHLVTAPDIQKAEKFVSGHRAVIRENDCTGCGVCVDVCRFDAIQQTGTSIPVLDPYGCEGCGVCVKSCPVKAIEFPSEECGEWFISSTRFGTMVHARLGVGSENSGKLVTLIRKEARGIAEEENASYLLVDGSPGIGCPVIASLTGAGRALVVTEPTVSGEHDLNRILDLTRKLGVTSAVCVNKWDLNPEITATIEKQCAEKGVEFAGRIRYDALATTAQRKKKAVVEVSQEGSAKDIRDVLQRILKMNEEK